MKSLTDKETKKEDVRQVLRQKMFALVLYPRSKAATGIESKRVYNLVKPQ